MDSNFKLFLKFIEATPLDEAPTTRKGYLHFQKFRINQQVETFMYNSILNTVNATYNGEYVTKEKDGVETTELIKLYKFRLDETANPYHDIINITEMRYLDGKDYCGLRSIAWRPTLSYRDGFKYGDIFRPRPRIARLISMRLDVRVNRAWEYIEDPEILLVAMRGYNFLTTVDMLAEDLSMTRRELLAVYT